MKTSILGLLYLASLTACNKGKMGHKGCTQQTTCETEDPNASLLHSWYNKSELTTAYIGDKLSTKPVGELRAPPARSQNPMSRYGLLPSWGLWPSFIRRE
ncbi:hypothetical protein KJE20_03386 [Pyrenophora tritici-repentis]|uniref:Lipoprotein n=1 Tax=Pyrenophora tritici-repentis TaxID=45151 RepID=A0A922SZN0_9PLEO|nr:hypothetical protein Ptr86124_008272 [Pyrenophora tritici-repentis]KAI1690208.1 hypothetical protein KJE20_03386 [Pyrenophora tritici-repentis]